MPGQALPAGPAVERLCDGPGESPPSGVSRALLQRRVHPEPSWVKDLATEQYQLIYAEPVYPKNRYLDRAPYGHDEYRREVIARQVELMHERDI